MEEEKHSDGSVVHRKGKLQKFFSEWIKDNHNKVFLGILILGIIIRLYYFFITKDQPLWWDESDYMAYAKTLAGVGSTNWIVSPQHNSLFPYFFSYSIYFYKNKR